MGDASHHHVELCKNPVQILKERQLFVDEYNKQLVSVTPRGICCTPIEGELRGVRSYHNVKTQGILNAKFSPDQKYLAVQFGIADIEFTDLEEGTNYAQSFKTNKSRGTILSFFWTYPNNFVVVMPGSIDLYQFPPAKGKPMKPTSSEKVNNATWSYYCARHRILLVASPSPPPASSPSTSSSPTTVYVYHFKRDKINKLPRFEIESNGKLGSQELVVHQVYDFIYCIHVNSHKRELSLYRVTADAIIRTYRFDLFVDGTSYVHVIDNLLLIHNNTAKVTLTFDIKSKDYLVASPLPLSPVPIKYESPTDEPASELTSPVLPHTPTPVLYSDAWTYYSPCYIIDKNAGYCWNVCLNLDGIVQSLTKDRVRMTEFLLRRTLVRSKPILVRELSNMITGHESLMIAAQVFDSLNSVLANLLHKGLLDSNTTSPHVSTRYVQIETAKNSNHSNHSNHSNNSNHSNDSNESDFTFVDLGHLDAGSPPSISGSFSAISLQHIPPPSQTPKERGNGGRGEVTVVTQGEMYAQVFVPHVGGPLVNTKLAESLTTEYIRSLNFHHIAVSPFFFELLINLLVTKSKFYQLHQLLQYHVVSDSTHVACQLLSLEGKYPPAYQLALDMMKRLNSHEQIVEVLLSKNLLLPALRFLKAHPRVKVPARRVLEAAAQTQDPAIIFHACAFVDSRKELSEELRAYYGGGKKERKEEGDKEKEKEGEKKK